MSWTTLAALHWIISNLSTSLLNWDGPKADTLFQVQSYQEPLPPEGDNSFLWFVGHVHHSKVTQNSTYLAYDKSSLLAHIHDGIHLNSQVLYNRPYGLLVLPGPFWYTGLFHTTCVNLRPKPKVHKACSGLQFYLLSHQPIEGECCSLSETPMNMLNNIDPRIYFCSTRA